MKTLVCFAALNVVWGILLVRETWLIAVCFGHIIVAMVIFFYLCGLLPVLTRRSESIVTLTFAHRGFTETMEDWRDWYHDHPEASFSELHEEIESGISEGDEP
ncbi:MAG: hypothetical protein ACRC8S_22635 [Fimbriiglobus sp.]